MRSLPRFRGREATSPAERSLRLELHYRTGHGKATLTPAPAPGRMPELPRPGQRVRWRSPQEARAWGWEDLFGAGPFEVVGIVGGSAPGLSRSLLLHTRIGERAIPEVWLALAGEAEGGAGRNR
jgi:hypothetical protein